MALMGGIDLIPPSHFIFVRAWEPEPTPLSIDTFPKEKEKYVGVCGLESLIS